MVSNRCSESALKNSTDLPLRITAEFESRVFPVSRLPPKKVPLVLKRSSIQNPSSVRVILKCRLDILLSRIGKSHSAPRPTVNEAATRQRSTVTAPVGAYATKIPGTAFSAPKIWSLRVDCLVIVGFLDICEIDTGQPCIKTRNLRKGASKLYCLPRYPVYTRLRIT